MLILPQTFSLGPLTIHFYGITMALAVLAGYLLARKRAAKFNITNGLLDKLFVWLIVGGFVGARSYHIISAWQYYYTNPIEIPQIWHGGLSVFGALLGGFITLILFNSKVIARSEALRATWQSRRGDYTGIASSRTPRNDTVLVKFLDLLAPSVLLGQIIGRLGNLFNYELIGEPTNLPWGMYIPEQFRVLGSENFTHFHPFPIYEQVLNLIWLLVLLKLEKKFRLQSRPGAVFALYLIGYGIIRFSLEWVRLDTVKLFDVIPVNALVSFGLVIVGIIVLNHKSQTTNPK